MPVSSHQPPLLPFLISPDDLLFAWCICADSIDVSSREKHSAPEEHGWCCGNDNIGIHCKQNPCGEKPEFPIIGRMCPLSEVRTHSLSFGNCHILIFRILRTSSSKTTESAPERRNRQIPQLPNLPG